MAAGSDLLCMLMMQHLDETALDCSDPRAHVEQSRKSITIRCAPKKPNSFLKLRFLRPESSLVVEEGHRHLSSQAMDFFIVWRCLCHQRSLHK